MSGMEPLPAGARTPPRPPRPPAPPTTDSFGRRPSGPPQPPAWDLPRQWILWRTTDFIRSAVAELRKVVWPSRRSVAYNSALLLIAVATATVIIAAFDLTLGQAFTSFVR